MDTTNQDEVRKNSYAYKKFKRFLAEKCNDLKLYKDGKYDKKIYDWFSIGRPNQMNNNEEIKAILDSAEVRFRRAIEGDNVNAYDFRLWLESKFDSLLAKKREEIEKLQGMTMPYMGGSTADLLYDVVRKSDVLSILS